MHYILKFEYSGDCCNGQNGDDCLFSGLKKFSKIKDLIQFLAGEFEIELPNSEFDLYVRRNYNKGVQIKPDCWCHRTYLYGSLDALDKSVSITKEDYEEFVPV